MKESVWGYWIIVLGISIIALMMFLQSYTTTSEQDYYLIKSSLEASMVEAVDYGYYRDTGKFKMNQEKFVENFLRRFSESVNINKTYKVNFYTISEEPPAASISVTTTADSSNFGQSKSAVEDAEVTNRLTAILYTTADYNPVR